MEGNPGVGKNIALKMGPNTEITGVLNLGIFSAFYFNIMMVSIAAITFWTESQSFIGDEFINWEAVVKFDHINICRFQACFFKTFLCSFFSHIIANLKKRRNSTLKYRYRNIAHSFISTLHFKCASIDPVSESNL